MPTVTVVLTEVALTPADADRMVRLHQDDRSFFVLAPADSERNLLVDVLDHLSLLELREALQAARGQEEVTTQEAEQALAASLAVLHACGAQADGVIAKGDPVAAIEAAVAEQGATEVVVLTRPHAVEDTLHTDWASKARERLGVPVLHVYAGSSWIG